MTTLDRTFSTAFTPSKPAGTTIMAISEHISGIDAVPPTEKAASLFGSIKSLAHHVRMWVDSCADYYAAAAMYEQLSKLSDTELHRRGLSRDTLARDVCRACDRAADR
jgi:hypothetical protein